MTAEMNIEHIRVSVVMVICTVTTSLALGFWVAHEIDGLKVQNLVLQAELHAFGKDYLSRSDAQVWIDQARDANREVRWPPLPIGLNGVQDGIQDNVKAFEN